MHTVFGLEEVFNLDFSVLNIDSENVTLTWRGSYNEVCNFSYVLIESSPISECNRSQFKVDNTSDSSIELPRITASGRDIKFNISIYECPSEITEMIFATFRCEFVMSIVLSGYS